MVDCLPNESEEYIFTLKEQIQELLAEKELLNATIRQYQDRVKFLLSIIADPERERVKNLNMHLWTCPKCEMIHIDEPVMCKCGYDNSP